MTSAPTPVNPGEIPMLSGVFAPMTEQHNAANLTVRDEV